MADTEGTAWDTGGPDRALARLLAAGLTYAEAGAEVGVSERTVKRRMRDAGFRALVESERVSRTTSLVESLSSAAAQSVRVLAAIVADESAAPAVRVRAAGVVLAELGRRVTPQMVQLSGGLDVSSLTAEEVRDALVGVHQEIGRITGSGDDGVPTGKVYGAPDVPAARAAVRPSEPPERSDDQTLTGAADDAPTVPPTDGEEPPADPVPTDDAPEDASEDASVVPMVRKSWQPDPELTARHRPWQSSSWSDPVA